MTPEVTTQDGLPPRARGRVESMRAMRKRGIRILPGGDYGFAWTPHGTNAKDLEYFVKYVGMSTMEALLSATAWGGPMMRMGKVLGYIREGYLADILLIDGDPLADITVLQDKSPHPGRHEGRRVPSRAAGARRAHARRAGPPEENAMADAALHQRPHPRRHRRATLQRQRAGARQPHPRRSAAARAPIAPGGATVIDGAGATLMPGMCEAHTHFSWNDAATLAAIQTHAARGARAVVRQGGQALPGRRLDVLRRRAPRQAAARRRDPQRDQLRPDPRPALPRREPGDHGARRARRRDAAAPALPGVQLRRQRELAPRRCARRCACS